MKWDVSRAPAIAIVVGLSCVVVAIGAGLQGPLVFGGPRWIPGLSADPGLSQTSAPQPTAAPTAVPPSSNGNSGFVVSREAVILMIAVLIMVVTLLLARAVKRRRLGGFGRFQDVQTTLGESPLEAETEVDVPTLQRGLLRAANVLEAERDPRDAIVRAWIGLQEAAEDSGIRRHPAETPTEFTTRVFRLVDADRDAAASLLEVYLRVRFRAIPATEADVAVARESIRRLRETWPVRASG